VSREVAAEIVALDKGLLGDRLAALSADEIHLKDMVALIDFELDVLGKQAGYQESEQAMQQKEIENARSLYEQGLIPLPRLQELEREASRMSRDLLENQAFAARARQSQASARYELDAAETKWRIDVRRERAATMLEQKQLEAELEALSAAALEAGVSLGDRATLEPPAPTVVIYRTVAGRGETLEARMETEIAPGDVLEVSLGVAKNG
jgi:polysaccharide export outer membrane protein